MKLEPLTGLAFRRNAAIVLSLAAAYLLVTDWIIEPWSACIAFAVVFGVAAAIAIRSFRSDFELRVSWILLPLLATVLWGLGQLAAGIPEYRFETWWSTLGWAAAVAFFWSALQVFRTARLSHALQLAVVIFGALTAFEAVLQLFSGDARIYGMIALSNDTLPMGAFRNRDHFCALMELILPLALWTGMRNQGRTWVYFTAAGIIYASVIASASRAGAVIATLETVVLLVVSLLRRRAATDAPKGRLTVAVAVLIAIAGGVVGWSAVLDRFNVQDLFAFRREFLQTTLRMIHDRPWFGFGLGSWPWVYPRYAFIDPVAVANHAHNDWVEWAANGGILFALFIGLVAMRALWLSLEMPWGMGTFAVFLHATVDFPFQRPPILIAVLLILAVMEIEHNRARKGGRANVGECEVSTPLRLGYTRPSTMNYYEQLGVPASASTAEIRQAYRTLARLLHPDHQSDESLRKVAEVQMAHLNAIQAVLTDAPQRNGYDASLQRRILPVPETAWKPRIHLWSVGLPGAVCLCAFVVFYFTHNSDVSMHESAERRPTPAQAPSTMTRGAFQAATPALERPLSRLALRNADDAIHSTMVGDTVFKTGIGSSRPESVEPGTRITRASSQSRTAAAHDPPAEMPHLQDTLAGTAVAAVLPPVIQNTLIGTWLYVKPQTQDPGSPKFQYRPEYIELVIKPELAGRISGRYHGQFHVPDLPISPEIIFEFQGPTGNATSLFPWQSSDGARGQVRVKNISQSSIEVSWYTTQFGTARKLSSGTAVLYRD